MAMIKIKPELERMVEDIPERSDGTQAWRLYMVRFARELERLLRGHSDQIVKLSKSTQIINSSGSVNPTSMGVFPTMDTGIIPGMLLNIDPSGVAYRAVSTNEARYCNAWALSIDKQHSLVTVGSSGAGATVRVIASGGLPRGRLWLSRTAGYATDVDPMMQSSSVVGERRQLIGTRVGGVVNTLAPIIFNPGQDEGL